MADNSIIERVKGSSKYLFTIYTPTYNRDGLLKRTYDALLNQTLKDFEWIIVNDASTDNTKTIVKEIMKNNKLDIKYFEHKVNRGKHYASKLAQNNAKGFFFLNLDSDDIPLPDALENLYNAYIQIPEQESNNFSAVTGLCVDNEGNVIGDTFPQEIFDSNPLEIFYKYSVGGDKWGFQKTEILRKYSYTIETDESKIQSMKFYPEIAIFGEIGKKYKTRYINKPLKIVKYHKDGLSKSKIPHAYPKKISALYRLNYCIGYFKYDPKEFFISAILYNRWALHSKTYKLSELTNYLSKLLVMISFPCGFMIYLIDLINQN